MNTVGPTVMYIVTLLLKIHNQGKVNKDIQLIQLRLSHAIVNCTMQVRCLNLKLQAVPRH